MSDKNKFYSLAAVVDNFMIANDLPNGYFNKSLLWAINGLREISLDTFVTPKTELFTVTDRNTIVLPPGFVGWSIVSLPGDRVQTLGVNENISSLPRATGVVPTGTQMPGSYAEVGYYLSNFSNGAIFSWGMALSTAGAFKVVDNGMVKELKLDLPKRYDQLYVEYTTDGINPCGETIIHPYLYDYLTKYMENEYEDKNNPKATEASKYRKSEDLYFSIKRLRARTNNLSPQTLINLARQYTTLALKL